MLTTSLALDVLDSYNNWYDILCTFTEVKIDESQQQHKIWPYENLNQIWHFWPWEAAVTKELKPGLGKTAIEIQWWFS